MRSCLAEELPGTAKDLVLKGQVGGARGGGEAALAVVHEGAAGNRWRLLNG